MYKKGFTLLEVVLSLIFISMIATYSIMQYKKSLLNGAIIELHDTVYFIIKDGIMIDNSGLIGYTNGTGDPSSPTDNGCSPNTGYFDQLTTQRLHQCMEWDEGRFTLTGSELTGDGLMDDYGNCTFETTVVTGDINSFDVFIDCSNINADQRVLSRIEDMLAHSFGPLDNSDLIAQFIYRNAVDITTALANETAGSGSGDDGMLRARFTKND